MNLPAPTRQGTAALAMQLPGLTITPTSAVIADTATAHDIAAIFRALDARHASMSWWLGDITIAAMRRIQSGDPTMHVVEPLVDQQTAARCVRVASIFPPDQRRQSLSWSHHEAVCGQPERHRTRLLDLCEAEGLSFHALRAVMQQEAVDAKGEELPLPKPFALPKPVLGVCETAWDQDPDAVVVLRRSPDGVVTAQVVRP